MALYSTIFDSYLTLKNIVVTQDHCKWRHSQVAYEFM